MQDALSLNHTKAKLEPTYAECERSLSPTFDLNGSFVPSGMYTIIYTLFVLWQRYSGY
jgi:hypothetical protein